MFKGTGIQNWLIVRAKGNNQQVSGIQVCIGGFEGQSWVPCFLLDISVDWVLNCKALLRHLQMVPELARHFKVRTKDNDCTEMSMVEWLSSKATNFQAGEM